MLPFLRMIDLTEHFIVKQKSILKHQKLLLQQCYAWSLGIKKSLNRQGSVNQKEIALSPPLKVSATLKIAIFPYLRFQHFQIDMLESFLLKKN